MTAAACKHVRPSIEQRHIPYSDSLPVIAREPVARVLTERFGHGSDSDTPDTEELRGGDWKQERGECVPQRFQRLRDRIPGSTVTPTTWTNGTRPQEAHWNRRGRAEHQATPPTRSDERRRRSRARLGDVPVCGRRARANRALRTHARGATTGSLPDRHRPILRVPRKHGKQCTSVIVFAKGVLVARMCKHRGISGFSRSEEVGS